jgi:hypothetical protein
MPFQAEVDVLRVAQVAEAQAFEHGAEQEKHAVGVLELPLDERPDALEAAAKANVVIGPSQENQDTFNFLHALALVLDGVTFACFAALIGGLVAAGLRWLLDRRRTA